jgi:hypothetical protein
MRMLEIFGEREQAQETEESSTEESSTKENYEGKESESLG